MELLPKANKSADERCSSRPTYLLNITKNTLARVIQNRLRPVLESQEDVSVGRRVGNMDLAKPKTENIVLANIAWWRENDTTQANHSSMQKSLAITGIPSYPTVIQ